jgi:SAM-dependent methyltransferase
VLAHELRLSLLKTLDALTASVAIAFGQFSAVVSEAMVAATAPADWVAISARAYARNPTYLSAAHNQRLFTWEEKALAAHFPPPPARVLVPACGGGRELSCLALRGYEVAGFDPAPRLVAHARTIVDRHRLLGCEVASYREAVDGLPFLERLAPFAAVVLGWASLSHIGEPEVRRAVLPALRRLCPSGPVLASWASGGSDQQGWLRPVPDGPRVRALRRLLSLLGSTRQTGAEFYSPHGGLCHVFCRDEIHELAATAAYRVLAYEEIHDYPHAVLAPV